MKYVEIVTNSNDVVKIVEMTQTFEITDFRLGVKNEDGLQTMRLLVGDDKIQEVLDALQTLLNSEPLAKIVVLPVEISLPKPTEDERKEEAKAVEARESLYVGVERNARLDADFIALVLLSTCVGAVGLIENSVAIVIGAMVIAPLLGPNLAFGLGTALGDASLMRKSALSTLVGLLLAISVSVVIGYFWPSVITSVELMARTNVGFDSIILALASGAAAALSLTTGLSSVLVGVMVAVALLPPAATLGIMIGQGNMSLAIGAGLLLCVNIVCVNLAIKIVFFIKGIRPRTWWEKKQAKHAMSVYIIGWVVSLAILIVIIYVRPHLT